MTKKPRLPLYEILLERGLAKDEREACSLILQGKVYVEGVKESGVRRRVSPDVDIEVTPEECPYVSRGGLKLQRFLHGLGSLAKKIEGRVCLDVGAGTGGFTEVLLEFGASRVYAVDVGKGILHPRLSKDPRVIVVEGVNAKQLSHEIIPQKIDHFTLDVSFISGASLLPKIRPLLSERNESNDWDGIFLIKPQFERELDPLDERRGEFRGGVVRSKALMLKTLKRVYALIYKSGFVLMQITLAEPRGAKGNYEFFALLKRSAGDNASTAKKERCESWDKSKQGFELVGADLTGDAMQTGNRVLNEEEFARVVERIVGELNLD